MLIPIYLLAWKIQDQLILNYDASWLMHAARRLLEGGTYSQDFFETNPPLILYLYFPPVIISKFLNANIILVFRVYIFLLASLSLSLCSVLVQEIFTNKNSRLAGLFILILSAVFLILPFSSLGQRDHLVVVFTLPYLFMLVLRLQDKSINPYYATSLGFLAGLGFAIKPHFLITLALIETYYALVKKSSLTWRRPETLALIGTIMIYGTSIFILQPNYVYILVPYALRQYYSAVSAPWLSILLHEASLYCCFILLFYVIEYKENPYKTLCTVLLLGMIGFLLSFIMQRMLVYYHLIPLLSLGTLLLAILFASLAAKLPKRWPQTAFVLIFALMIFSFPLSIFYNIYSRGLLYKNEVLSKLVTFMNTHAPNQSVYFLSTAGYYAFPSIDYTTSKIAPRFYFLWMAAGLANQELKKTAFPDPLFQEQQRKDKNFFINMVADDLYMYKPSLVFIDLNTDIFSIKAENPYPAYLSANLKFQQEWKNYSYYRTLEKGGLFKLAVYKRRQGPAQP